MSSCVKRKPGSQQSSMKSSIRSVNNDDDGMNEISKNGQLYECWAKKLRKEGMPERLIHLVKLAEFELWINQESHKMGNGLFYSSDFQDLPPRFQKKIMAMAYQVLEEFGRKEKCLAELTNNSVGVMKEQEELPPLSVNAISLHNGALRETGYDCSESNRFTTNDSEIRTPNQKPNYRNKSSSSNACDPSGFNDVNCYSLRNGNTETRSDKSGILESDVHESSVPLCSRESSEFIPKHKNRKNCSSQKVHPREKSSQSFIDSGRNKQHNQHWPTEKGQKKNFLSEKNFSKAEEKVQKNCFPSEWNFSGVEEKGEKNQIYDKHKEKQKLLQIFVLEKVDDILFWKDYLTTIIGNYDFRIDYVLNDRLVLRFPDIDSCEVAFRALEKRDPMHCKNILKVISAEFKSSLPKIVPSKQVESLQSIYERKLQSHTEKIEMVNEEFKMLQKDGYKSLTQLEVVKSKINALEVMKTVFQKYYKTIQDTESRATLFRIRNLFLQECACFDACLPIYAMKEDILKKVNENQVVVLVASTGSGKSTQLVQYLYRDGIARTGTIVCAQPRKVAAVSLCNYVSTQMGSAPGELVGYEHGVRKKCAKITKIVFMTDYALLQKLKNAEDRKKISCVIVDEAHERSLYTDLLLGLLKGALKNGEKLNIIISSATIEPKVFLDYFGVDENVVIDIPGRLYPVDIIYSDQELFSGNHFDVCVNQAFRIHTEKKEGAILVFLVTPSETEEAVKKFEFLCGSVKKTFKPMIFALHGKLETEDQLSVFSPTPAGSRKIIFCTNVAETSLTIPDVKYVVDCGMAKECVYDKQAKRGILVVESISSSSADQRKGRAGRTQCGVCYRMYSEDIYNNMKASVEPEILRAPLQEALLKLLYLGIDPYTFDFISSPSKSSIHEAIYSLQRLRAVKGEGGSCITDLGRKIARLPVRPELGKLVIDGINAGIGYETIAVVAMSKVSSRVFTRTEENKKFADQKKVRFCNQDGDLFTLLSIYHEWSMYTDFEKKKFCHNNYISMRALSVAEQIVNELCKVLSELKLYFKTKFDPAFFYSTFKTVLFNTMSENFFVFSGHVKAGFISPFMDGSYFIHPSSALSYLQEYSPQFLVCMNTLQTSRNFLIDVTPIPKNIIIEACQEDRFEFPVDLLLCLQVVTKVFSPISEIILVQDILGREGENMRQIESTVQKVTRTKTFHIEVFVDRGEIVLHIEEQHLRAATAVIEKAISKGRTSLLLKEIVVFPQEVSSVNAVLGSGGIIRDVVLPGESREVIITQNRVECLSNREILYELKRFGMVVQHSDIASSSSEFRATYDTVAAAKMAISGMSKIIKVNAVHGKIVPTFARKNEASLFEIQVNWSRLGCSGTGHIAFVSSDGFMEASSKLGRYSFYVDENYVIVTPAEGNRNKLLMRNLPEHATEETIGNALFGVIDGHIEVEQIVVERMKSCPVSQNDIMVQTKKIQQIFARFAGPQDVFISVKPPIPTDPIWQATVSFSNFEDGEKAISSLGNEVQIGHHKIELSLKLKFSTNCSYQLYKCLEDSISDIERKFVELDKSVKIKIIRKGGIVINVSCNTMKYLVELRKEFAGLFQGRYVHYFSDEKLNKLFSQKSEISFKEIEKASKTVIYCDRIRKIISIFGTSNGKDIAVHEIKCINITSKINKIKVFNLHGSDIPTGFIKKVYREYGLDFHDLIARFNLKNAYLKFTKHQLVLQGTVDNITRAEEHLESLCRDLFKESQESKSTISESSQQELCPVCLDGITKTESVRLEFCGHAICKSCLELQLKSLMFPVLCATEKCEKPLVIDDFQKIFRSNKKFLGEFGIAAVKHFMKKNPSSLSYCPTPDCQMIYRIQKSIWLCPSCENTICTRCHSLYHHGMSCDMFKNTRLDEDYPLKAWQQADSSNRKACPACKMAIEKDGGCNHVVCGNCQRHMCWNCLSIFDSDRAVYEHMQTCIVIS